MKDYAEVLSLEDLQKSCMERDHFQQWVRFYQQQSHEELLEALVYEHENDFPLRRSGNWMDRLRHRALVMVLDQRAQTEFLRSFLRELNVYELN